MIADVKKQNLEAHNFISDSLLFLETLNKFNGKKMSVTDEQAFLENINEFSASFIYFREAYDQKSTNIHHLAVLLEDIRIVVDNGNADYKNAANDTEAMDILLDVINDSTLKMGHMDAYLKDAEKEEQEYKRMQTVERVFLETKQGVEGAEKVFKKVSEDVKNNMSSIHAELEKMDHQFDVFENNAKDVKKQCDKVAAIGDAFEKGFKDWEVSSNAETKKAYVDIIAKINENNIELTNQKDKSMEITESSWAKTLDKIEKKSATTLNNVEQLNKESQDLLKKEGVKQFLVYGGSVMAGLNFFLLIALFLIK